MCVCSCVFVCVRVCSCVCVCVDVGVFVCVRVCSCCACANLCIICVILRSASPPSANVFMCVRVCVRVCVYFVRLHIFSCVSACLHCSCNTFFMLRFTSAFIDWYMSPLTLTKMPSHTHKNALSHSQKCPITLKKNSLLHSQKRTTTLIKKPCQTQ